jgi:hypothetical protein
MKSRLFFIACLVFSAFALSAQSNEFVDKLLSEQSVTVGQAAYLVMVASDNLSEDADETRAFDLLDSLGWAPRNAAVTDPIRISQYAYMLMKAFDMKGSLMYTLFPSARYAYRSLVAVQVIQDFTNPNSYFDGSSAIQILGRVFDVKGIN